MAPWWKRHAERTRVCERCKGVDHVHGGLCRHCREQLRAEATPPNGGERPAEPRQQPPARPDLERPHDRPWVHRGGG